LPQYAKSYQQGNYLQSALEFAGSTLQAPQSLYLNAANNLNNLIKGQKAEWISDMSFADYTREVTAGGTQGKDIIAQAYKVHPLLGTVAELLGDTLTDPMILLSWSEIKKLAQAVKGTLTPQAAKTAVGLSDDAARAAGGAADDAVRAADDWNKVGDVPDLLPGAKAGADDALGALDDWDDLGDATDIDRVLKKGYNDNWDDIADTIDNASEGAGKSNGILSAGNKAAAIKSVDELPADIQPKVKNFFKGGSNSYTDFSVNPMKDGSYVVKMTKPGNVPGSKAIYYKVIDSQGNTIRVYKETYNPAGKLVHVKDK